MTDVFPKHDRRSIRLPGVDYSVPGFYFVTICTKNREHLFGEVTGDAEVKLNEFGKIVKEEWAKTAEIRPGVVIDEFVVMPNHLHGIILITDKMRSSSVVGIDCNQSLQPGEPIHPYGPQRDNLFAIIRGFKGVVTKRINILRGFQEGGSIWQSRFHEHIIRDNRSLDKIRVYIRSNPLNWSVDLDNIATEHKLTEKQYLARMHEHYNELFK